MLGDTYCVASETCAFDIIGAQFLRDVQPGEIVSITEQGHPDAPGGRRRRARALCVFEHIYFARPDSRLGGQVIQVSRGRMGEILAREAPVDADLVIPVPDSGNPAARGFARASGLPQDDGLIKNRYVARTFIQPGQELRKHGLRLKFNPLPEVVAGKRIVVVDDSIVRGNTTRQIVQMLRDAGRRRGAHAHLRAADPPSLPLRDRHVDARGDDRPQPHGGRGGRRAGRRLARLPVAGGRLRGDRRLARDALRRVLLGGLPTVGTSAKDAFENALAARSQLSRAHVSATTLRSARDRPELAVRSPARVARLARRPARRRRRSSLDLGEADGRVPRVPVASCVRRRRGAAASCSASPRSGPGSARRSSPPATAATCWW